jgi:hypothetical protein
VQFTREKIPDTDLCFVNLLRWTHSWYWNVRAKLWVRSCVCGEIYPSPAPESSSPSQTRTCMGTFTPEPSSPARTLGSWFRIPLEAGMSVRVYFVCVVLCVSSGLATGWSRIQGALPTVYRINKTERAAKVQRAVEP